MVSSRVRVKVRIRVKVRVSVMVRVSHELSPISLLPSSNLYSSPYGEVMKPVSNWALKLKITSQSGN